MGIIEGTLGVLTNAGAPAAAVNEEQTLTLSAVPASGTFRVAFQGQRTALLAHNVSAANMQTALRALKTIGANGVTVALGGQVYTVTFGGGNMAGLAQPLLTIEDNTVKDAGNAAVTITVAESVTGVTATGRGAAIGALLMDTTNKDLYVNAGTELVPVWAKIPDGITATAAVLNAAVAGVAASYKLARGQHETVAASDDINTGLATVVSIVASFEDDPVDGAMYVSAAVGNQAGAPAAGHAYIKTWKNTDADATLIAATTFAKKVNWIAVGT